MKRANLNFLVDSAAGLLFLGMVATGFILRFTLPPGTHRSHILWGLTRHEWGTVHTWLSFALVAVILLHVALHWQWIACLIRTRFGRGLPGPGGEAMRRRNRRAGIAFLLALLAACIFFGWATFANVRIEEREPDRPRERQRLHRGSSAPQPSSGPVLPFPASRVERAEGAGSPPPSTAPGNFSRDSGKLCGAVWPPRA